MFNRTWEENMNIWNELIIGQFFAFLGAVLFYLSVGFNVAIISWFLGSILISLSWLIYIMRLKDGI